MEHSKQAAHSPQTCHLPPFPENIRYRWNRASRGHPITFLSLFCSSLTLENRRSCFQKLTVSPSGRKPPGKAFRTVQFALEDLLPLASFPGMEDVQWDLERADLRLLALGHLNKISQQGRLETSTFLCPDKVCVEHWHDWKTPILCFGSAFSYFFNSVSLQTLSRVPPPSFLFSLLPSLASALGAQVHVAFPPPWHSGALPRQPQGSCGGQSPTSSLPVPDKGRKGNAMRALLGSAPGFSLETDPGKWVAD